MHGPAVPTRQRPTEARAERAGHRGLDRQLRALLLSAFVGQPLCTLFSTERHADLVALAELIEAGQLTLVIHRTYPLAEVPQAVGYLRQGRAQGKLVVRV